MPPVVLVCSRPIHEPEHKHGRRTPSSTTFRSPSSGGTVVELSLWIKDFTLQRQVLPRHVCCPVICVQRPLARHTSDSKIQKAYVKNTKIYTSRKPNTKPLASVNEVSAELTIYLCRGPKHRSTGPTSEEIPSCRQMTVSFSCPITRTQWSPFSRNYIFDQKVCFFSHPFIIYNKKKKEEHLGSPLLNGGRQTLENKNICNHTGKYILQYIYLYFIM